MDVVVEVDVEELDVDDESEDEPLLVESEPLVDELEESFLASDAGDELVPVERESLR